MRNFTLLQKPLCYIFSYFSILEDVWNFWEDLFEVKALTIELF